LQEDGALGFKSHTELLSLRPAATSAPTSATTSNTTSSTTSGTAGAVHSASAVPLSSSVDTTADPVQQLLRQISAAELHHAVSLRRDAKTAAFDLSPVLQAWGKKDSAPRIFIQVE